MNKIEIVKYLLAEIEAEQQMFKDYQLAEGIALAKNKEPRRQGEYYYSDWKGRNPSKVRIANNIKKIRQLLMDVGKEI